MYTIYYGTKPNGEDKIGCDKNYPSRPLEQNLTNYFILEEHEDIMVASKREQELQKEHGLRVDLCPYYISCRNSGFRGIHTTEHQKKAHAALIAKNPNHQSEAGKKGGLIMREKFGSLTMDDAREIRSLFSKGDTYNELANKYNVSYHIIYRIIKNERYKENE